jgi:hypothetical protein
MRFDCSAWLLLLLLLCAMPGHALAQGSKPRAASSPSVGLAGRLRALWLPGTELRPRRLSAASPVVLRVVKARREGTGYRYELEYIGLERGSFDLTRFLERKDHSPLGELPAVEVVITGALPVGVVEPERLPWASGLALGGYQLGVTLGALLWLLGFVWLLWRPTSALEEERDGPPRVSFADRLSPLVERAVEGRLTPSQRDELERLLIGYWRAELGLGGEPEQLWATLRSHPRAAPLIEALDLWLYAPPGRAAAVDLGALLAPYRELAGKAAP